MKKSVLLILVINFVHIMSCSNVSQEVRSSVRNREELLQSQQNFKRLRKLEKQVFEISDIIQLLPTHIFNQRTGKSLEVQSRFMQDRIVGEYGRGLEVVQIVIKKTGELEVYQSVACDVTDNLEHLYVQHALLLQQKIVEHTRS